MSGKSLSPARQEDGTLVPGIHNLDWPSFRLQFGRGRTRLRLIDGMAELVDMLRLADCQTIYVGGSLVTAKHRPADFDACFDPLGVDLDFLKELEPALLAEHESDGSRLRKLYGGTMEPIIVNPGNGQTPLSFYQFDTRTGKSKGVVALKI
ncbi:MAG: hypothetical protein KC777_00440 [Cyanobacteria bacterium HKST-UBA02]|nr:hypothetical protein [Cyanobacteria bacterium HKST-UBA02]